MNHEYAWKDLGERVERAANALAERLDSPGLTLRDRDRLRGKLAGVKIVGSYIREYEALLAEEIPHA